MLNNDIDNHIFAILPISDKRSFLRTCKNIHQLSIHMPQIEYEFQKMLNNTGFFHDQYYSGLYNSLYKYSMELIYDSYKVPNKYIIPENRVMHQFPKIYKRGDLHLIKKMLKLNRNNCLQNNADYVMKGAADMGNIKILKWMHDNGYQLNVRAATSAAKGGQFKTLKWLIDHGCVISDAVVYVAALKGHLDILNFLIDEKKCNYHPADIAYCAALGGHLEYVELFYSTNPKTLPDIALAATKGGHLEILKFAYRRANFTHGSFSCSHINIFDWLIKNNHFRCNMHIIEQIASSGNLECLQFIYSKGYNILDKRVFTEAVSSKNIAMIKWLHKIGCPSDASASSAAFNDKTAKYDKSLKIIKLLVSWNCELKKNICSSATLRGDLDALRFLYEYGCKLDDRTVTDAALNGHLHIIIWAREQGCTWNELACRCASAQNHLNVLKWLRGVDRDICELKSNEKEICPWDENVCVVAIKLRHVDILKFALDNGCDFGEESLEAVENCKNVDILKCIQDYELMQKLCNFDIDN